MHFCRLSRHAIFPLPDRVVLSACNLRVIKLRIQALHIDGRNRLSDFWTPTGGIAKDGDGAEDSHDMLVRAGFVRQTHAGVYHMLPLGLRVQEKVEKLLDKHMTKLGASKVSLSTLSSEELWRKSGRLQGDRSELFRLEDRKGTKFLLSPTHEEEITTLVRDTVHSYKDLPLRLYQITRKYRDELRPRQGLLRTREFVMKDLYTFDATPEQALQTYGTVRTGYSALFDEFKIPYLVAEADPGAIGGDLSHEYHFVSAKGEDEVFMCDSCDYVANEEVAKSGSTADFPDEDFNEVYQKMDVSDPDSNIWTVFGYDFGTDPDRHFIHCISKDRRTLIQAVLPRTIRTATWGGLREPKLDFRALKRIFPDFDDDPPESTIQLFVDQLRPFNTEEEDQSYWVFGLPDYGLPESLWARAVLSSDDGTNAIPRIKRIFDYRLSQYHVDACNDLRECDGSSLGSRRADLIKVQEGDYCPKCKKGALGVQKAVELGHTFYLGTKYSKPLDAYVVALADSQKAASLEEVKGAPNQASNTAIEMGCHGIGVSRLLATVADVLADEKGLNWPRVIAPFEAVVIPAKGLESDALEVLDVLSKQVELASSGPDSVDAILDDRQKDFGWKLHDADLIGYPIVVVLGRAWRKERKCEVQCRSLASLKQDVSVEELKPFVLSLLSRL